MDSKSLTNESLKINKDHKVSIDNRKKITLTAIVKAVSANENAVILQLQNFKATILGKNLHINKLDINDGVVEIVGLITSLKYSGANEPQGFFKRMLK